MINNDILRRISTIFEFTDEKMIAVFALNNFEISAEKLACFFKEKDDANYTELLDVELASFLNGLIVDKRGVGDGPQHQAEQEVNNNLIFNKLKIALAYKAEDVIAVLALADLNLSKHELSALFRNVNHKRYRECNDQTLSAFLKGLKIKLHA
ncbi:DUF1456 family protein [Thalassotalea piscium]|uniref:Uncharacterized protein YehS (DUF1456 family) n=1 Tax=Thalassotalea piscium TaxID=1230533 RepID=A0A7X0TUK6_9GAMM|nr:DUF1456 family protein [Thalassotalea piscium]MBB6544381.1 uncharacterized protein YehS (DUF1456 family) [Thalassotalea piscium]